MLLGIKLQASGLMTSAFIYWAMLPAFFFFLWGACGWTENNLRCPQYIMSFEKGSLTGLSSPIEP